jgi:pilus assembly protein CpaF
MAVNPNSNIIAVTGGKGGVGKSVFAANLAFAFMESRQPVLLIDLDSQSCGDQNVILGMREVRTMSDLTGYTGAISQGNLAQVISFHPKNLGYVAAVRRPDESLSVQVDLAMKQLESLSNFFAYIIVDVGTSLGPLQLSVIERATAVLMVSRSSNVESNSSSAK